MVKKMELPILEVTTKESEGKIANSITLYCGNKAPAPIWISSTLSCDFEKQPLLKNTLKKGGGGREPAYSRGETLASRQIQSSYFKTAGQLLIKPGVSHVTTKLWKCWLCRYAKH